MTEVKIWEVAYHQSSYCHDIIRCKSVTMSCALDMSGTTYKHLMSVLFAWLMLLYFEGGSLN